MRIPGFARPKKKIQQRQLELRARLWPELDENELWTRHTHDGFSTIPSGLPLIMSIMDDLSKGRPVSMTYLDLLTRAYDECFVTLAKPKEMAFHSGFTTQRAERTWKQKLEILADLGFIDLKSGSSGPASYALIKNPYLVIGRHHASKTPGMREDKFNALVARAIEIGDKSFSPPTVPATPTFPQGPVPGGPNPLQSGFTALPLPPTPWPQPPVAPVAVEEEQA